MFKKTKVGAAAALAAGGIALAASPASAQQQLERVEITGSSIKRIEGETALPVQILTREDIQRTGATTAEQLLQTVSAFSSSQGLVASSASGQNTAGISAVSLRGLGSRRTLVLVNGRRLAPYGIGFTNDSVSVDVNSIPLAAVERVEVLKDGASAIYGSDAIGGVVNFILRRNFSGGEITAEYGDTTQGGASSKRVTATVGFGDLSKDRFNVMLVGSLQKESALFGRDRKFASNSVNLDEGNDLTSGNTFPANIAAVDGSFGSSNPTAATGCLLPYSFLDPLFPPTVCRFDPAPLVTLLPQTERASLFASARFALTNETEAFVEASFNRNKARTVIQPVPLSDQFNIPSNNVLATQAPYNTFTALPSATIILSPSSPFYPTAHVQGLTGGATPDLFVRYRASVSGDRDFTDIAESPRLAFGVRTAAAGWDLEAAALYSASKVRETPNDGYPLFSTILPLLNSGTVNFFGPNNAGIDGQIRAADFVGEAFSVKSSLTGIGVKGARDVAVLPAGPVAVAVGVDARQEKYTSQPSAAIAAGDISGYGGNLAFVDRSRDVEGLFAEVNLPIVAGLEANAAVRFDRYQGVGNSTTPKLGLRWQPTKAVLVRGSIGKGYRAPSLADLYTPSTTAVTVFGLNDPARCDTTGDGIRDCATQFATTNGGNANLKPEKSTNLTLGIVFQPTEAVLIGFDAFKVTLKDTITPGIDPQVILQDAASLARFASLITRGPIDPAFPTLPGPIVNIDQTNLQLGQTRLSGVDVDFRYRIPAADLGRFTLGLDGTYFIKFETQNPDGSFTPAVDRANGLTGGVIPRLKTYQWINWSRGPWDATLALNWQKSYHDLISNFDGKPRKVGAYETVDFQTAYSGIKNLRLTLGIKNLFDRDPPYSNTISFQTGYDPQYSDPRGRFVYGRVAYAFK